MDTWRRRPGQARHIEYRWILCAGDPMLRSVTLSTTIACGALVLACSNDPTSVRSPADPARTYRTAPQLVGERAFSGLALKRGLAREPVTQGDLSDGYLVDAAARIINPDDYVCQLDSPVWDWVNGEFNESLASDFPEMFSLGAEYLAHQVPFVEARFVLTEHTPQSFGYDGEFTDVLQQTERDVKRFWDIFSDDVQLLAMKGTMLQDEERTAFVYQNFFSNDDGSPITPEQAAEIAATVRTLLLQAETLDGGNHPMFNFNAFASWIEGIPPRIVMGDGWLEGFKAVGLADVASQATYAHEFAHHIQHQNGYFADPIPGATPPVPRAERIRYTELMADAMAAYYLTHKRGAALNKHRVVSFLSVFFQIGDCAFTDPNHHGTPLQRMRAAQFGFDVADQAQTQGHILTSDQFRDLFVAEYPKLVAPDAT
jgi:hypothetical protein